MKIARREFVKDPRSRGNATHHVGDGGAAREVPVAACGRRLSARDGWAVVDAPESAASVSCATCRARMARWGIR